MSAADEHRPPLRDSAKSSSRADQIRQRVAVSSSSFRTLYLEWFARLSARDFDEGDVAAILDAAAAELAGLQMRYRGGGITEAGLAYGREQIRDLLERVIRQHAVTATTKRQIRHLITDSFERRLLSSPGPVHAGLVLVSRSVLVSALRSPCRTFRFECHRDRILRRAVSLLDRAAPADGQEQPIDLRRTVRAVRGSGAEL